MTAFLFPTDMLNPARPDAQFAWQAQIAHEEGHAVALVDLDALSQGSKKTFKNLPSGEQVVYFGWMLSEKDYSRLEREVSNHQSTLLTSAADYLKAHYLPGWYETLNADGWTPKTITLPTTAPDAMIYDAVEVLGGEVIVKDYVKSRKHEWDTACYIPSPSRAVEVVRNFVRLQGDDLVGGIVLRQFEHFSGTETRVWWVHGMPVTKTAHPDQPNAPVLEYGTVQLRRLVTVVQALNVPFCTTDLAVTTSGAVRVVEVGDGQVSEFPQTGDFSALLHELSLPNTPAA